MQTKQSRKYFCRQKQVSMSFEILTYIAKFEKSVAKALFLQLDFDMIRYRFISKAKKVAVKQQYKAAMDLDTTVGKLTFMEKTKFLDDAWEKEMAAELKIKADLFRKYISIVNSCEKITANTVKIVSENPIFPMSPVVSNRLFTAKKYGAYVSAKTGWDKAFSMETGARGDVLWPEYLRIFSSDGFEQTRGYMIKNISFLERIRDEHTYGSLAEENMLQMTGIDQDEEIIKYVSENYSVTFLLKYFSQIHGFKNRIAAEAYLEVVKSHEPLKSSDALYGHTYEKLVDGYLKGSYTRMRNKD